MSRRQVEEWTCDLCGYGGAWTTARDFQSFGDVDLCRWCADDRPKQWLECGGHRVTFTADDWSCTCGMTYARMMPPLRYRPVWDVVPNPLLATANAHTNR